MIPQINEQEIITAAEQGMDEFIQIFAQKTLDMVGSELNADSMQKISADQTTLLAYLMMRDEMMDGGFVQLIHNGYGPFIFDNPFALMLKRWGLRDLSKLLYNAKKEYHQHEEEIKHPCSDEEFMALFERHPEFDDYDDEFVENEERWTAQIAHYVDENIDSFAEIIKEKE